MILIGCGNMKKKKLSYIYFILALIIMNTSIVFAEELNMCEKPGVLRTMKILGIMLLIIKIMVPILLIITSIIDFGKSALSGNGEDIKKNSQTFLKRCLAAAIIFILPSFLDYIFNNLVDSGDKSSFQACSTCFLNPNNCTIPKEKDE